MVLRFMTLSRPTLLRGILLFLPALAAFLTVLFLGLQDNRSPVYYHNDEPSKVDQVTRGYLNFRHPLLMVRTVDAASALFLSKPLDGQAVAELGRTLSATAMAGAVALLVLLATQLRGFLAGGITAVLLVTWAPILENAHYFKEDSWFLLGLALVLAAASRFESHPSRANALLLGIACALAASSKYIGILFLPIVLFWAGAQLPCRDRKRMLLSMLAAFVLVALLINYPILTRWTAFQPEFDRELYFTLDGHYGVGMATPHLIFARKLGDLIHSSIWFFAELALLGFIMLPAARKRLPWLAFLLLLAYLGSLSFSAKYSDRYLIPAGALVLWLAGLGLGGVCQMAGHFLKRGGVVASLVLAAGGLAVMLPANLAMSRAVLTDFTVDDRIDLVRWMNQNLAPGGIAMDEMVQLDTVMHTAAPEELARYPVEKSFFSADLGTPDQLRARGIRYVLISRDVYHRYADANLRPAKPSEEFDRRHAFYSGVIATCPLLWKAKGRDPKSLHPGLELYGIEEPLQGN
jgi:hypothetical protein